MKAWLRALVACSAALGLGVAGASTWELRPGQSLADALRKATDGDTIVLMAGEYRGQVGVIEQKRLTLRGAGGRPVLHADGQHAEGKAILVVRDGDVRIENIEFRGARVADLNGAGIRFERGRLLVSRCSFVDNQNGILTANFADAELTVEDSEFAQAPAGVPLPHLIYVGRIARFTLTGSRVRGGRDGHLVKSRARENHILYNRLVDGPGGRAAYELELPNGGIAYVIGNVIAQGPDTTNRVLVSFGAEGSDERDHALVMAHNTLVSRGINPGVFVRVDRSRLGRMVEVQLVNNLSVGFGVGELGLADPTRGNFTASAAVLQDVEVELYGLGRESVLRGRGVAPGTARGVTLAPQAQFTLPAGTKSLAALPRWSPGAYQD